jgi:hypothetical protein
VAEVPDQPEDQKRDEEDVQLFSFVTKLLGQQRTMAKAMTQLADGLYEIAKAFEATELDVRKLWEAAYRAGREDLLRSGSCPECTAGDPHNEPDVPHIHLTPYGYLLYAADHERPGFIEEIRAVERRAGREDAAREAVDLLADMVVKCTEYGTQDGDFVASYLLPTGPVHRAIPWLDQRGINVRPGFDGRAQR